MIFWLKIGHVETFKQEADSITTQFNNFCVFFWCVVKPASGLNVCENLAAEALDPDYSTLCSLFFFWLKSNETQKLSGFDHTHVDNNRSLCSGGENFQTRNFRVLSLYMCEWRVRENLCITWHDTLRGGAPGRMSLFFSFSSLFSSPSLVLSFLGEVHELHQSIKFSLVFLCVCLFDSLYLFYFYNLFIYNKSTCPFFWKKIQQFQQFHFIFWHKFFGEKRSLF